MDKLPNKFKFSTITGNYIMAKHLSREGSYCCYELGEDTSKPSNAVWQTSEIERNIKSKNWIVVENLDEPELVFPFDFTFKKTGERYTATQGSKDNWVRVIAKDFTHDVDNQYLKDTVKSHIKAGAWIVKSVGTGDILKMGSSNAPFQGILYGSSTETKPITIKVDSSEIDAATIAMQRYAQAVEDVNIALESMQEIMFNMGLGNGGPVECVDGDTYDTFGF